MQHALVTIEQNAPSATAPKATPEILSGKPNYAAELVDMLANTEEGATTVQRVVAMATTLTCEEFDESLKRARDVADTIDAANGFKKPANAKGQANYGPKRQLLNVRASEAKRIFGVAKQGAANVVMHKGYAQAVIAARTWLGDMGKTWDGNRKETTEEKEARRIADRNLAAQQKAQAENPQKAGETYADWQVRIANVVESAQQEAQINAFAERVETIRESLLKQFGDELDALKAACAAILGTKEETQD